MRSSFSVLVAAIRRKDDRNFVLLCDRFKRILDNKYPRSHLIDRKRTASPAGGGGGYILVKDYWGCAAGWSRIFTTGLTIMGLHF